MNDYSVQGINSLAMCVRDARAFYHLLVDAFGFEPANIYTYLDLAADSAVILQALRACVVSSEPGDTLCFYFSGHGSRLPHPSNPGQFYETIIPARGRWISDHELFLIADGLQPSFVNFTCVFDSCHSGGMSLEAQARTPPMEQALVERIVAEMRTLIPCGMLLAPEDRVVCENNVANVRLRGRLHRSRPRSQLHHRREGQDHGDHRLPFRRAQLRGAGELDGQQRPDDPLAARPRQRVELPHRPPLAVRRPQRPRRRLRRPAVPGLGIVQRPQVIGQHNRLEEGFLEGFIDSR